MRNGNESYGVIEQKNIVKFVVKFGQLLPGAGDSIVLNVGDKGFTKTVQIKRILDVTPYKIAPLAGETGVVEGVILTVEYEEV